MTADGPATLACSNLTRKYGHLVALRSVSLSVAPGECLTLFGHNGAGKSTLLGVAAGLSRNYEGDVFLFGKNLRGAGDDVRASVGFVAHETFLYNDLTALENLIFFGRLYCVPDPRERAGELLERFGLVVKSRDSVRSLSRGMKQRLSLARAVVHDPGLLLLDEPFTGLDERACDLVSTMVRELVKNGGSALVTTHDIDRGLEVATRATILDHGAIVYQTDPHAIDATAFREKYLQVLRG